MEQESISILDKIKLLFSVGIHPPSLTSTSSSKRYSTTLDIISVPLQRRRLDPLPLSKPPKPRALQRLELKIQEKAVSSVYDQLLERACKRRIRFECKSKIPLSDNDCKFYHAVTSGRLSADQVIIEKFNVEITVEKAACLRDRTWLNDEVINFYFSLLQERNERLHGNGERVPKCVFLNSFFYTKLSENGYNFDGVKRWTKRKKIDIFEQDIIFFPVNLQNVHWCLGVINLMEKKIEYFDSMHGRSSQFFQIMRNYIVDEYRDKKGDTLYIDEWKNYAPNDIPRQENGYDCGMFVCKFADFRSSDVPVRFSQTDLPYFRKRMLHEISSGYVI